MLKKEQNNSMHSTVDLIRFLIHTMCENKLKQKYVKILYRLKSVCIEIIFCITLKNVSHIGV